MIFNLKDVLFVAVGDTGPAPTPPPSLRPVVSSAAAPGPRHVPRGIPTPPSPKRAKTRDALSLLLRKTRLFVGQNGYQTSALDEREVQHRAGNHYGDVVATRAAEDGGFYSLTVRVFYDGSAAAEVLRWSSGTHPLERMSDREIVDSFVSADLADVLAWR